MMDKTKNHMTEKILKLALEIIYLLTGEDYGPVDNSTIHPTRIAHDLGKSRRSSVDHGPSLGSDESNEKILEVTKKILELLTGEVPIRHEDIIVCFSMEEWEYVQGHKDVYKDLMGTDPEPDNKDVCKEETNMKDDEDLPSPHSLHQDTNRTHTNPSQWRSPHKRPPSSTTRRKHRLSSSKSFSPGDPAVSSESPAGLGGNFSNGLTETPNPSRSQKDENSTHREEEHGDCTEGKSTEEVKSSPPGSSPSSVDTFTATSYTEQYVFTSIKEEAMDDQYGPQQNPSAQKSSDSDTAEYSPGRPQYTLVNIKQEQVLTGEEDSAPDPVPALHAHVRVDDHLYIPTDCAQRLHPAAPGIKANKTWNKTPEKASRRDRQSAHVVDGMYVCSTCQKTFTSHFGLVKHQAMHNGSKVSCPQCGKLFFYKSSLAIHQRIHTGEKLFSCPVCSKCFTNNSNLVVHQRIHTGEKPFVCSQCGKRFGHKGHLNRHLRTHETEKPGPNSTGLRHHHKINGWSYNMYDISPYYTYDKSV
ncbi:uncharacterized protein [Engystomops pustulosus]|uniref:uncharacterized protein n=1 Tax=Engystomops pustulosus TaxID=76066 RepID=UPI003AFACA9E